MQFSLRALGLGLTLGDPCALLGLRGLTLTSVGLGAVLARDGFAALLELALTLLAPCSRTHPRLRPRRHRSGAAGDARGLPRRSGPPDRGHGREAAGARVPGRAPRAQGAGPAAPGRGARAPTARADQERDLRPVSRAGRAHL